MKGLPYKDTLAAKGSALYEALIEKDLAKAKKIYDDTTQRFYQLYNNPFKEKQ